MDLQRFIVGKKFVVKEVAMLKKETILCHFTLHFYVSHAMKFLNRVRKVLLNLLLGYIKNRKYHIYLIKSYTKEEKTTWERAQREEERAQIINIGLHTQRVEERKLHPIMDRRERTIG